MLCVCQLLLQIRRLLLFLLEEEEDAAFVRLGQMSELCHTADHQAKPTAPAPATCHLGASH